MLSPCYCWNADKMLRLLLITVQKFPSAFSPHFFHIRMQRFLLVPVRILLAEKMQRSGVWASTDSLKFSCIPRTITDWISLLRTTVEVPLLIALRADWAQSPATLAYPAAMLPALHWWPSPPQHNAPAGGPCWVTHKTRRDTANLVD